jgi:CubicO group peptidase (beta-lactamase class C family)
VETDTLFPATSLSKPLTAVVAAAASEGGQVDL